MIRLGVSGACGRMGQAILKLASNDVRFEVVCGFEHSKHASLGRLLGDLLSIPALRGQLVSPDSNTVKGLDVVIDFSNPVGTLKLLQFAGKHATALVVGTTGHQAADEPRFQEASKQFPLLMAANMSVGAVLAAELAMRAAQALGNDYKIRIDETHHIHKKDKPSGTALYFGKKICAAKHWDPVQAARFDWESKTESRTGQEIVYTSKREGEVIGIHDAIFEGPEEVLKIHHQAHSRDTFARGALHAAAYLVSQKPGRIYAMEDVLRLSDKSSKREACDA